MRAVTLLVVVTVASSASIDERVRCCGPTKWQARALASAATVATTTDSERTSSKAISGKLSVDHGQKTAMLYLTSMGEISNTTMAISINDSTVHVYFVVNSEDEAQCTAYAIENTKPDIGSNCFPAQRLSMLDGRKSQLPKNLLAYEFTGVGGLFAVQMAVNTGSCRPSIVSMATGASDGLQVNVMLSDTSETSDEFDDSFVQDACSDVEPMSIKMPNVLENRRGSKIDSLRSGSADDSDSQQLIADVVTLYIVQALGSGDQQSPTEILNSATTLKDLLQNVSSFLNRTSDDDPRSPEDDSIAWLVTRSHFQSVFNAKLGRQSR